FFTYNHAGGIAVMLAAVWMHFAYLRAPKRRYAWGALAAVLILGLIKINFAVTTLFMTALVVFLKDRLDKRPLDTGRKSFYAALVVGVPLVWFVVYAWCMQGLSIMEMREC